MPCHVKAWKFKRLLSQKEESCGTENLRDHRFLGAVIPHEGRNSEDSIVQFLV